LKSASIIENPAERAHNAGGDREIGREQPMKWVANRNDGVARTYRDAAGRLVLTPDGRAVLDALLGN